MINWTEDDIREMRNWLGREVISRCQATLMSDSEILELWENEQQRPAISQAGDGDENYEPRSQIDIYLQLK